MNYLGLDLSSQGLKATLLDEDLRTAAEFGVNFDQDLAHYGTRGGAHLGEDGSATSPTRMFLEAMDVLLSRMTAASVDFGRIRALSASGQQHGSVYWRRGGGERLRALRASETLLVQLGEQFAVPDSPIWMDASTAAYCAALEEAVGGAQALAEITGSKAFRRFTGEQIAKIYDQRRGAYDDCERVSLISTFVASVFLGNYAPDDVSDASGTNLIELRSESPRWNAQCVRAVARDLAPRLCDAPVHSFSVLGRVATYFQQRYGFSEQCRVVACAGDNPCSAAGMLLQEDRDLCVSLGTSDTAFMLSREATPQSDVGSVYRSALSALAYIPLVVYANGSLTREDVRDSADGRASSGGEPQRRSWDDFERMLNDTPPGNDGLIGLHLTRPEIVPATDAAITRYVSSDGVKVDVSSVPLSARVRAAVEMRCLAILSHTRRLGMVQPERVVVTGGASNSIAFRQVLADVLGCPVYVSSSSGSAGRGAALRAYHGVCCERHGFTPFLDAVRTKLDVDAELRLAAEPREEHSQTYADMLTRYEREEARL